MLDPPTQPIADKLDYSIHKISSPLNQSAKRWAPPRKNNSIRCVTSHRLLQITAVHYEDPPPPPLPPVKSCRPSSSAETTEKSPPSNARKDRSASPTSPPENGGSPFGSPPPVDPLRRSSGGRPARSPAGEPGARAPGGAAAEGGVGRRRREAGGLHGRRAPSRPGVRLRVEARALALLPVAECRIPLSPSSPSPSSCCAACAIAKSVGDYIFASSGGDCFLVLFRRRLGGITRFCCYPELEPMRSDTISLPRLTLHPSSFVPIASRHAS